VTYQERERKKLVYSYQHSAFEDDILGFKQHNRLLKNSHRKSSSHCSCYY